MTVQSLLEQKLTDGLQPAHLQVINESPQHNVPEGAESHFRAIIVSKRFQGLAAVKRHQLVHSLISLELKDRIHAFSQRTFTPEEWQRRGGSLPSSPPCAKKPPAPPS